MAAAELARYPPPFLPAPLTEGPGNISLSRDFAFQLVTSPATEILLGLNEESNKAANYAALHWNGQLDRWVRTCGSVGSGVPCSRAAGPASGAA